MKHTFGLINIFIYVEKKKVLNSFSLNGRAGVQNELNERKEKRKMTRSWIAVLIAIYSYLIECILL